MFLALIKITPLINLIYKITEINLTYSLKEKLYILEKDENFKRITLIRP